MTSENPVPNHKRKAKNSIIEQIRRRREVWNAAPWKNSWAFMCDEARTIVFIDLVIS